MLSRIDREMFATTTNASVAIFDAAPEALQLSLNITADPPSAGLGRDGAVQTKVRFKNKYEKRRARAAAVRAAKNPPNQQRQQQQQYVSAVETEKQITTTSSTRIVRAVPEEVDSASVSTVDSRTESPNIDSHGDRCSLDENDSTTAPSKTLRQGKKEPKREDKEKSKTNATADMSATTPKESQDQQQQQQETADRAAYLAEFHARPLELDRRAGAVRRYEPSKASNHLFTTENSWEALSHVLHSRLQTAMCGSLDLSRPTLIQSKAIPEFSKTTTNNLFLHSETGSGKTLAYLLPILHALAVNPITGQMKDNINRSDFGTRCIILCPTRELASQTMTVAEKLCTVTFRNIVPGCLLGECGRKSEKARIRKGLAIVIATPGRLLDHLARTESLLLALKGQLQWLVLDEADRLLDMGLGDQVQQILQRIRANQSGSGVKGITWRSVLVSATVTEQVQTLAKETLIGGNNQWVIITGENNKHKEDDEDESSFSPAKVGSSCELANSTPRQLIQLHMTVSAKLRLTALVAFLADRCVKGEKSVVFVSTCAAVDYYHALWQSMDCILSDADDNNNKNDKVDPVKGIFGSKCPIFKLHGSIPHGERQLVLRKFMKDEDTPGGGQKRGSVLLATDVAARGLNLPSVDWIVQYDSPGDVSDYVHRAGRVARAGRAGHSLLFLLPSERDFLTVLKHKGVKTMSAISLASTLNTAAAICTSLTDQGGVRSGGGLGHGKANSRSGEAFSSELQHRLEDCVIQDDIRAKASAKQMKEKRKSGGGGKREEVSGELLELARRAFLSYMRAYPTKEKLIRHIFAAKALHLGHVARSFALKEPPKRLGANKKQTTDKSDNTDGPKKKQALAFDLEENEVGGNPTKRIKIGHRGVESNNERSSEGSFNNSGKARSLLMANAIKLQNNGLDSL